MRTAAPSAKMPTVSSVVSRPRCSDVVMPAASSASTPITRTAREANLGQSQRMMQAALHRLPLRLAAWFERGLSVGGPTAWPYALDVCGDAGEHCNAARRHSAAGRSATDWYQSRRRLEIQKMQRAKGSHAIGACSAGVGAQRKVTKEQEGM